MAERKRKRLEVDSYVRDRIREARRDAKETQADLAKVLGKTREAISDLERGRVSISVFDLLSVAEHFNKPINYFLPITGIEDEVSPNREELLILFQMLPKEQQEVALEYMKLQTEVVKHEQAESQTGKTGTGLVRRVRKKGEDTE